MRARVTHAHSYFSLFGKARLIFAVILVYVTSKAKNTTWIVFRYSLPILRIYNMQNVNCIDFYRFYCVDMLYTFSILAVNCETVVIISRF